ncbi:endodeoxyribonuclease [Saitoella coloradoensis]
MELSSLLLNAPGLSEAEDPAVVEKTSVYTSFPTPPVSDEQTPSKDQDAAYIRQEEEEEGSIRRAELVKSVEAIIKSVIDALVSGEDVYIELARRNAKNSVFEAETGTFQRAANGSMKRIKMVDAKDGESIWRFTTLIHTLDAVHIALLTNTITTKRDIYYTAPALYRSQRTVDTQIDDIACTLSVNRSDLNVVAAAKGLVCGNVVIVRDDGGRVECGETEGVLVPDAGQVRGAVVGEEVNWVLVIEKEATFRGLANSGFWKNDVNAGPGILVTAKGYPDLSTRALLHLLHITSPTIPLLALVDHDPHGLDILLTYTRGSTSLAHQNALLSVPSLRLLGVRSGHIPNENLLQMTSKDRRMCMGILGREGVRNEVREEVRRMLWMGRKGEIQGVESGDEGLGRWIGRRIRERDWV